jgi:phosphoribosylformylglycinamidine (FGAM) synthase PurS component
MKKFLAKIIVKMKPSVKDIKGDTLKNAVESFMSIKDLSCTVGSYYELKFCAHNQVEALHEVEKISRELLSNDVIETFEIVDLEEI